MASKKLLVSVLIVTMAILLSTSALTAGPEDKSDVDLTQQKLAKKLDAINYHETPLSEVLYDLRARSGLNIIANWNALAEEGVEQDKSISLELHDVTVKKVLRVILNDLGGGDTYLQGFAYVVDENVITISSIDDLTVAAEAEVQQKLRKKIKKVDFQEIRLREAIDFIQNASGMNINVKWNLLGSGASGHHERYWILPGQPISLRLSDVSAEKALAAVLDSVTNENIQLVYVVDENVVTVTTRDDLDEAKERAADEAEAAASAVAEAEFPQKKAERVEMKLGLIGQLQKVCFDPAAAGLIATAGLKDDVSRERPEIIKDLEARLGETKSLGLRNALHLVLRDLYKANGNNEKVLEHLRAMLRENDAAIVKRQSAGAAKKI